MVKILEKISKKNDDWIRICMSFGADLETAKDCTQDMYIKVFSWLSNDNDRSLLYEGKEVNYFFIWKCLRSIYLNHCKHSNKYVIKEFGNDIDFSTEDEPDNEALMADVEDKLKELYWYDRQIFEMVYKSGISMLQISQKTGIDYSSIKRTIKKVKKQLNNNAT